MKECTRNQLHCSPCMASRSSTPREVSSSEVALSVPIPIYGHRGLLELRGSPDTCNRLSSSWQECMVVNGGVFSSVCQEFPPYEAKMVAISYQNSFSFYRAHFPPFIPSCQLGAVTQDFRTI